MVRSKGGADTNNSVSLEQGMWQRDGPNLERKEGARSVDLLPDRQE